MFQADSLKDQMLKSYIEQIFNKYDGDRNGSLDAVQMTSFFNDLFRSLNISIVVTQAQAVEAIKSIDVDYDGKVSKDELFNAFKIMLNTPSQPPQVTPNYGQNYAYNQQPYYGQQNYINNGQMAYGNAFQNNAGQMNYMQMQASQNQAYMNQPSYLQATSAHNVPQLANNYMQGTNPQYNGYPNNAYMGQYAAYRK